MLMLSHTIRYFNDDEYNGEYNGSVFFLKSKDEFEPRAIQNVLVRIEFSHGIAVKYDENDELKQVINIDDIHQSLTLNVDDEGQVLSESLFVLSIDEIKEITETIRSHINEEFEKQQAEAKVKLQTENNLK